MAMTTRFSDDKYINTISQEINPTTLKIKKEIGEGSFGNVYLGKWNNMKVAVKTLKSDHAGDHYIYSLFLKEICITRELTQLNAPNVVKFLGFTVGSNNLVSSYFMEKIAYSMEDLLDNKYTLSNEIKYKIIKRVTKGLAWLHENHFVHRDIKPSNILVDCHYRVKLCDFGSARNLNDNNPPDRMIGSARWLAPEIIHTDLTTQSYSEKAADVWSLCSTYWQIYASILPFDDIDDELDVVDAVADGRTEDISKVNDPKVAHLITTYGWIAADRRATAKELLAKLNEPDTHNDSSQSPKMNRSSTTY